MKQLKHRTIFVLIFTLLLALGIVLFCVLYVVRGRAWASSSVCTGRQLPMNRDFFSMNSSAASRSTVTYSTALSPFPWVKQDRRRETAPPIPGHKAHYCVQIQKTLTDYLSCRP